MLALKKLQAFVPWHVAPVCVNSFYHLAHVEGEKILSFDSGVLSTGELVFAVGKQHLGQG